MFRRRLLVLPCICLFAASGTVSAQDHTHEAQAGTHDAMPSMQQSPLTKSMEQGQEQMSSRNLSESAHMKMTPLRAPRAGDQKQADMVLASARAVMEKYRDYRVAEADGYEIFLPNLPQKMYHFTNNLYGWQAAFNFDPDHPTSLLYEKQGSGYKLIGLMYTAAARASMAQLDERVPLSVAQWHAHTNFCSAPKGHENEYFTRDAKYGLLGSITTKEQCDAAGGTFIPQIFGWMVHVYPDEKDPAQIWSVERQMEHGHMDHGEMHMH